MTFERRDIDVGELTAILERAAAGALSPEERDKLKAALDTLAFLTNEIGSKGASLLRLRQMLFGASTEKSDTVFPPAPKNTGTSDEPATSGGATGKQSNRRPGQRRGLVHGGGEGLRGTRHAAPRSAAPSA